jgi:hypothetical protein
MFFSRASYPFHRRADSIIGVLDRKTGPLQYRLLNMQTGRCWEWRHPTYRGSPVARFRRSSVTYSPSTSATVLEITCTLRTRPTASMRISVWEKFLVQLPRPPQTPDGRAITRPVLRLFITPTWRIEGGFIQVGEDFNPSRVRAARWIPQAQLWNLRESTTRNRRYIRASGPITTGEVSIVSTVIRIRFRRSDFASTNNGGPPVLPTMKPLSSSSGL